MIGLNAYCIIGIDYNALGYSAFCILYYGIPYHIILCCVILCVTKLRHMSFNCVILLGSYDDFSQGKMHHF